MEPRTCLPYGSDDLSLDVIPSTDIVDDLPILRHAKRVHRKITPFDILLKATDEHDLLRSTMVKVCPFLTKGRRLKSMAFPKDRHGPMLKPCLCRTLKKLDCFKRGCRRRKVNVRAHPIKEVITNIAS